MARQSELSHWRDSDRGRLAEIIIIDQFSRNAYRNDPRAFSHDPQALVLAQEATRLGCDQRLLLRERPFLYMPWMHSESLHVHQEARRLLISRGLSATSR